MKPVFTLSLVFVILLSLTLGCSTRQVSDKLTGATEQRLMTHSIDALMSKLPPKDFSRLKAKKVYLQTFFIQKNDLTDYATQRLEIELQKTFQVQLVPTADAADMKLEVFFTSLGTDQDQVGFSLPPMYFPGVTGTVTIDLLALDMYHGISELYYYMVDNSQLTVQRGEKIKSVIRTDKLSTPILTIPISTLK